MCAQAPGEGQPARTTEWPRPLCRLPWPAPNAQRHTPAAFAIATLVTVVPPLFLGADWIVLVYRGLALLLLACPCALVLSTPAAIASGLAIGARRGLLIKGGGALEAIGRIRTVAWDKTGTLTAGRPPVTDVLVLDGPKRT